MDTNVFFFSADSLAKSDSDTLVILEQSQKPREKDALYRKVFSVNSLMASLTPPSIVTYLDGNWHAEVHGYSALS